MVATPPPPPYPPKRGGSRIKPSLDLKEQKSSQVCTSNNPGKKRHLRKLIFSFTDGEDVFGNFSSQDNKAVVFSRGPCLGRGRCFSSKWYMYKTMHGQFDKLLYHRYHISRLIFIFQKRMPHWWCAIPSESKAQIYCTKWRQQLSWFHKQSCLLTIRTDLFLCFISHHSSCPALSRKNSWFTTTYQ